MTPAEYEQLNRTIDRFADNHQAKPDPGFVPFSSITEDRVQRMTDNELAHAILGVQT